MKYFVLFLLLAFTHTRCALAAPPPVCYPGVETYQLDITAPVVMDPKVERFFPYFVTDNNDNCAVVWFCDAGHQWDRYEIVGHGDNADNCGYGYAKASAALFMTHAQKDALWIERFVDGVEKDPVLQAQYREQDAPANLLALSVPTPTAIPPSGLVTQATVAYKRSEGIGSYTVKPVGTVPLAKLCNGSNEIVDAAGQRYHALINRNDATMTPIGKLVPARPTTLYGICVKP